MRHSVILLGLILFSAAATAQTPSDSLKQRLTVGGYGEATFTHGFYSNNPYRYMYPDR